ncbi:MAG: hypothetical protein U0359_39660 [Byssovorax sp.]
MSPFYQAVQSAGRHLDLLRPRVLPRPIPLLPILPDRPAQRSGPPRRQRHLLVGPALLLLADGRDLISTSVVGNELRRAKEHGRGLPAPCRRDHLHGQPLQGGSVNVVVLRIDRAPAAIWAT